MASPPRGRHAADADAVVKALVQDGTFDALRRRLDAALAADPAVVRHADARVATVASSSSQPSQPPGSQQPASSQPLAARPRADAVAAALADGGAAALLDGALAAAWRAMAPGSELGGDVEAAAASGLAKVWGERDGVGKGGEK